MNDILKIIALGISAIAVMAYTSLATLFFLSQDADGGVTVYNFIGLAMLIVLLFVHLALYVSWDDYHTFMNDIFSEKERRR